MLSVKKNNAPSLSIVIPVYNSQDCIEELLDQILKCLNNLTYEVILVDDKSIDSSWETMLKCFKNYNTNIYEKVLINDLKYTSVPKVKSI